MRITDNGRGLPDERNRLGMGLRNMQERIEQLDGSLRILSSQGVQSGTAIEVTLPLTHMLSPGGASGDASGDGASPKQEIKA